MMKKIATLTLLLALLACLSGYLMSKASFAGRLGMTFVYKEYAFLKTWWKGALFVFVSWMIFLFIESLVHKKFSKSRANIFYAAIILIALVGLYFTYSDFQHTVSHRWLKEKFHIGGYLFWLGFIIISVFFIVQKKEEVMIAETVAP